MLIIIIISNITPQSMIMNTAAAAAIYITNILVKTNERFCKNGMNFSSFEIDIR